MKNITLSLPDEAADAFMMLSNKEKSKATLFLQAYTKQYSIRELENALKGIATEVRKNGMNDDEINNFLDELS